MKRIKGTAALLLALLMTLSLCACGGSAPAATAAPAATEAPAPAEAENPLAPYAGEYKEYSVIMDGTHLILDGYEDFSVTLAADGTGYLDWGADNQGPISGWSKDGDKVTVKAGVSEMDGSLKDGVLILEMGDGFALCFAKDGADTSSMPRITLEEYKNQGQSSASGEPETVTSEPSSQSREYPVEGDYTFFAREMQGEITGAGELQVASTLRLAPDGTGFLEIDGEVTDFTSWTLEGDTITITFPDDSSAPVKVENGFAALDIYGNGAMLHGDVEASAIEKYVDDLKTPPSSMLYSYWNGIDPNAGAHLSYEVDSGYMDAHQIYDVHTKDGVYYSAVTTQVSGMESTRITFFRDGTAYNLYPEDMTGIIATTTNSSIVTANVLRLDHLYLYMDTNAKRKDFTVETREIDGVTYTAEVFPADSYTAEAVYCFDANGQLVYYIEGAPVMDTGLEMGESVYRLHTVDTAVNEALFDISAYTIS